MRSAPRALLVLPDGQRVVSASTDHTIVIRELPEGREVDRIDLGTSADWADSLAATPDGRALYVGTARGVILRFALK